MKKYIFFLLIFITLTSLQCKKTTPEEQLPPITTTGANTFGCLVNGNAWLPYGGWSVPALTVAPIGEKNLELSIDAYDRKNGALSDISITVVNLKPDTATYRIYNYLNEGLVYSNGNQDYEPFDTFGVVHISRCDTVQQIISGTFSFVAYTDTSRVTAKSVSVTDGRFDLHYPLTIH